MIKDILKLLCLAVGLGVAGSASAATLDLSGTNFYMKFLDGNQLGASSGSIDTASGNDQGQFTEMNLVFKATISPKVEAGGRIQSRSSAAYWSEYGGFGLENGSVTAGGSTDPACATLPCNVSVTGSSNNNINHQKFMKLRGAYVELSPGYEWLSQVRIGTSDWGMFDPFTVGKVRYIDRDNYNGLYFKGPIAAGSTWELAGVSLPTYLQFNYGQGAVCCSTDNAQYNEAVYIAQVKVPVGGVKLATSYQSFIDHAVAPTANAYTGVNARGIYKNTVFALKADGSLGDVLELRGAYYRSTSEPSAGSAGEVWGNTPTGNISDKAIKLDADLTQTPVEGLSFNFQYFNIGAGYFSAAAARRESDVLLTEGSEAAWYNWGNPLWSGGATSDFTQGAASPKGRPGVPNGTQNGLTDNDFIDFNESPAESVIGWKGLTMVGRLDVADTPMSLEVTRVSYNNNWQNYSTTGPLFNVFPVNQDRTTNIFAFKLNHVFSVMGGLDTNFKLKRVDDKDKVSAAIATDDRDVLDNGASLSVGNQLFNDLHGTLSYGRYIRDIKVGGTAFNNSKSIYSVKFAYNLPGFELGMLTQWIRGNGYPTESLAAPAKIQQYRMKTYAQVNF
jgi:hypothetical protein